MVRERTSIASVLIVGGSRLFRDGLEEMLERTPGVVVAGVAADVATAPAAAGACGPDVILLELGRGDAASVRAIAALGPPVVAMTVPDSPQAVIACARAGVVGFVAHDASLEDLVAAIEAARRGETTCSPRTVAILLDHLRASGATRAGAARVAGLTAREREIVVLIEQGLTNKEIARGLFIALPTVKNHVHNILEKLGVTRRSDIALLLRRERDLVPGD